MKHLKKFNEELSENDLNYKLYELQEFCETSLAYLIDEGFEVSNDGFVSITTISLWLPSNGDRLRFDWNDVKDHYIPFLQLLSRRYELMDYSHTNQNYVVYFQGNTSIFATLEQVINDDIPKEPMFDLLTKVRNMILSSGLWSIKIRIDTI